MTEENEASLKEIDGVYMVQNSQVALNLDNYHVTKPITLTWSNIDVSIPRETSMFSCCRKKIDSIWSSRKNHS